MMRLTALLTLLAAAALPTGAADGQTTIVVDAGRRHQKFDGMGCGVIFYEGHVTSLAARGKLEEQEALYDRMFRDVPTDYLHLMIRHDHEPANDNADPFLPEFKDEWFDYCRHTLAICEAARARRPGMRLYATLYTPPAWMKTNNDVSAGGKARGTIRPDMERELGEFCWAFLEWMNRHGQTVEFLSIANEPDWEHTQPGYFLTPEAHTQLFVRVGGHLEEMARRFPAVPRVKLVGPNTLSAVDAAEKWVPPLLRRAGRELAVVGSHDYDRRGDRWRNLVKVSGGRPVWCTEWCVNAKDESPQLIRSAAEYWLAMTEAFNGGATGWMAYDWVYPPRPGGEALIHVDWGQQFTLTKIHHGFRQWCLPLEPGMSVVASEVSGVSASGFSQPGVKAAAFVSADGRRLVVHAANVQDKEARVMVRLRGTRPGVVQRLRTSSGEDVAVLPPLSGSSGELEETLPPRGMMTWLAGFPEGFGKTEAPR